MIARSRDEAVVVRRARTAAIIGGLALALSITMGYVLGAGDALAIVAVAAWVALVLLLAGSWTLLRRNPSERVVSAALVTSGIAWLVFAAMEVIGVEDSLSFIPLWISLLLLVIVLPAHHRQMEVTAGSNPLMSLGFGCAMLFGVLTIFGAFAVLSPAGGALVLIAVLVYAGGAFAAKFRRRRARVSNS